MQSIARFNLMMLALGVMGWSEESVVAADKPPNIVMLLADDLGYGDLGCYGHPYAKTPNLDELASEGTRFQQFYVSGITCCPSRTAFMTGRFPARFAKYPAEAGFADRVTVTALLKQAGYATGHFGKWHIGPETKAGTYGIDVINVNGAGNRKLVDERGRDAGIYDQAIQFIEQHHDHPFYVNVWGHMTHFEVDAPQAYEDRFQSVVVNPADFSEYMQAKLKTRSAGGELELKFGMRNYLGELLALDDSIGRLLDRLDELGLSENTIVVFTSDHGPDDGSRSRAGSDAKPRLNRQGQPTDGPERMERELNMLGYAGPLRGGKHTLYEGGVRVPLIVRWPGHVPAGRVDTKSVLCGIDWLPTICQLAGVKINAAEFDGEDVSAAWLGQAALVRTKPLFWKTNNVRSDLCMRAGDWKLLLPNRPGSPPELYNLALDSAERNNVATAHPEIVQALRTKLEQWNADLPTAYEKATARDD